MQVSFLILEKQWNGISRYNGRFHHAQKTTLTSWMTREMDDILQPLVLKVLFPLLYFDYNFRAMRLPWVVSY